MNSLNLLTLPADGDTLVSLLKRHPVRPLLPPLGDPAWVDAAEIPAIRRLMEPLWALAEAEAGEPLPALTDALYADFARTGVRLTFERVYFERRRRLGRAAVALLLTPANDPRRTLFTASLVDKLTAVFSEVSWALPAHVNWKNDDRSGKEPLCIDLFCAETANLMAEMLDVFASVLPDALVKGIRARLQEAIFENFLARDFHWMEVTHNWNAVCHQGVVGAALSQVDDPTLLARILSKAAEKLPHFLSGFTPDGGCSEGPAYWNYGFGWFTWLNVQLETRTRGELSLFAGNEAVRIIARYGPRMALAGGNAVNFADGPVAGVLNPATLIVLAERLDDPECRAAAIEHYRLLAANGINLHAQRTDFFHLSRKILRFPKELLPPMDLPEDAYFPDLAVLVARGTDRDGHLWEFAAKGGHNAEHHNHNDCGSFLLNVDAHRFAVEIGAPEYVQDFFGARRYEFLAARSLGHSVPWPNRTEQAAGREFAARVLEVSPGNDPVRFALDLSACYPASAGCRNLTRTFLFEKHAGRLTVTDDFLFDQPGEFVSMVLCADPVKILTPTCADIQAIHHVRIIANKGTRFVKVEECPYRGHRGEDFSVHRLHCAPSTDAQRGGRVCITFSIGTGVVETGPTDGNGIFT